MKKIICSILVLASIVLVGCKKEIKPESIIIGYSDNSLVVGEELALTISSPTERANLKVKWTVDDSTIGTVSSTGVLKGVKVGTVEVTATSTSDTTKSDKVVFYVIDQITKEYRQPIIQLLKFSKDQDILAKFGAWRQASNDNIGIEEAKGNFDSSLSGWIEETTPYIGSHPYGGSGNDYNWLYYLVDELVYNIDRGISFEYVIGSIDEYRDHFFYYKDEFIEDGYSDLKVIEVYKKITTYNTYEVEFSEYYYFAIGKKNNKLEILDYTKDSYFYSPLGCAEYHSKDFTITEIPISELDSSFDYYLDPDYSDWGNYYDINTIKAYKGFISMSGVEITSYSLVAMRIKDYIAGSYYCVYRTYDIKFTTALSTLVNYVGHSDPSYFTTITDSSFFNQDSYNYYVENFDAIEILKFNYPNLSGYSNYYAIVKDGDRYELAMEEYVITNPLDFLSISLEMLNSFSSFTYTSIAESDFDSSIKNQFDSSKEELNLTEIVGYKVNYINQFVTITQSIYFFKDTAGHYYYHSL